MKGIVKQIDSQIVIEYECTQAGGSAARMTRLVEKKALLLHPEDWEKALPLIGKEVDIKNQ